MFTTAEIPLPQNISNEEKTSMDIEESLKLSLK